MTATRTIKTVLVVDDEEPFLLSLVDALQPLADRFRVITAPSGNQALDIVHRLGVDLVVTDLMMPGMDGFALLAALQHEANQIPVMVMTAYNSPATEGRLRQLGSRACLDKPVDLDRFVEAILGVLEPPLPGPPQRGGWVPACAVMLLAVSLAAAAWQAQPPMGQTRRGEARRSATWARVSPVWRQA